MSVRKIYLSVDFDYFSREEREWDWGHSERAAIFTNAAWHSRSQRLEETSLERYANPHPRDFWEKLGELGFDFSSCESLVVANSHQWAAPDFLSLALPLHEGAKETAVVNFDAHHDMGYQSWKVLKKEWLDKLRVDCSNWLLGLMHQLPDLQGAVVYPEWKGLKEVQGAHKLSWQNTKSLSKRFQYGVYNEEYVRSLAGEVVGIFVAKSSAWMPPWHDQAFTDFVEDVAGSTGLGAEVRFEEEEGVNPLKPRDFDLKAAQEMDRKIQEALAALREKLG